MKRSIPGPLASMLSLLALIPLIAACHTAKGATQAEKQAYVIRMKEDTLRELTEPKPELAARIRSAAGYAVFSNVNAGIFIVTNGNGYGVVVNNRTREKTYMRMAELGAGIGMGLRQLRQVFIFHDEGSMASFIEHGLELGGDADATAKAKDRGIVLGSQAGIASGGASMGLSGEAGEAKRGAAGTGVEIYELTSWGVALRANVTGTKYWKDKKLNADPGAFSTASTLP